MTFVYDILIWLVGIVAVLLVVVISPESLTGGGGYKPTKPGPKNPPTSPTPD